MMGPTRETPKLIAPERRSPELLACIEWVVCGLGEVIIRIQHPVPQEFVRVPVELVGARLTDGVHNPAVARHTRLRNRRSTRKLLNRFRANNYRIDGISVVDYAMALQERNWRRAWHGIDSESFPC